MAVQMFRLIHVDTITHRTNHFLPLKKRRLPARATVAAQVKDFPVTPLPSVQPQNTTTLSLLFLSVESLPDGFPPLCVEGKNQLSNSPKRTKGKMIQRKNIKERLQISHRAAHHGGAKRGGRAKTIPN